MTIRTRKGERGPRRRMFFIADATAKHQGALKDYVYNVYGREGFVKHKGRWAIRAKIVNDITSGACPVCNKGTCVCPDRKTRQRAQLALTLRNINKRRFGK